MNSGGLLTVRARPAAQGLEKLEVALHRPPVARLFIGQHPEAVVKTVPYLYTLCAGAQRAAAQAALAAAQGEPRRPVDDGELWIEVLHENFWRLLLDWPAACGLTPAKEAFVAWRNQRQGEARTAATQQLLDEILPPLAEHCLQHVAAAAETAGADFPDLDPAAWLAYWQGRVGAPPVPRQPLSVGAALRQRLAETRIAAQALAEGRAFPVAMAGGEGWGIGQALTARGVLTHAAQVGDGRVSNYRVWAPTDCHFADATGLRALLADWTAEAGAARAAIERAVLALDPCLPYVVELEDA